jgi:hypothetical protein
MTAIFNGVSKKDLTPLLQKERNWHAACEKFDVFLKNTSLTSFLSPYISQGDAAIKSGLQAYDQLIRDAAEEKDVAYAHYVLAKGGPEVLNEIWSTKIAAYEQKKKRQAVENKV